MAGDVTHVDECALRLVDPATVAAVRAALPDQTAVGELSEMFALLSDPARLRLLTSLLHTEQLCVCDLAAASGLRESAVSHALRLLRAHRVVAVRRVGRMAYYRLEDTHVRLLLELGLQHIQHSDSADSSPAAAAGNSGRTASAPWHPR